MDFQIITSTTEWESLAEEWNLLLAESITNVPFLRHEYLRTWWQNRGGGEWPEAELCVICARETGRLKGVAPLFVAEREPGTRAFLLLGSIEISDYLDLIVRPQDLGEFLPALLDFLCSQKIVEWQTLDWFNLPEDSPSNLILQMEGQKRGWKFTLELFRPVVCVPLPGDFDLYLAGIDKKQRHEIRRKMRRAAEYDLAVRWTILDDEADLGKSMEAFLELMGNEPDKHVFLSAEMRQQILSIAQAGWQAGWLQLAFLEVGGQKAAAYLNFDYNGKVWVYNSGLDKRFLELSPGWVLLGHLLQWANENGRREFDFMRGAENYKFKFGGRQQYVMHTCLERGD